MGWAYTRETLTSDLVAALIVTIMLIPQSLTCALLAGRGGAQAGLLPRSSRPCSSAVRHQPGADGLGLLRPGFVANFLSHPVIAGVITASGVLIATSQMQHVLGIRAGGHSLLEMLRALVGQLPNANLQTVMICASAAICWMN